MRINVVWIDDLFKVQDAFISQAEQEGIDITPFESHEEGIHELISNGSNYHAIILDAKVKNRKDDTSTSLAGLKASRDWLIELNKDSYLPFFIFTGQPDYMNSEMFRDSYGKYYIKAEDNARLFNDIKEAVNNKEEFILQKEFSEVFLVCSDNYIGLPNKERLLNLIKFLVGKERYDEDYFNSIRKMLEAVLFCANRYGLLHDKCLQNGKINVTWASLFIEGKIVELPDGSKIYTSNRFPAVFSNFVSQIKELTNNGSHYEDNSITSESDKNIAIRKISELLSVVPNPYLLKSLIYQLFDVLLCLKGLIDSSPSREVNVLYWKEQSSFIIEGIIKQDIKGNYYFDKYLLDRNIILNNGYKIGDIIQITESSKNNNLLNNHLYSEFARRFK